MQKFDELELLDVIVKANCSIGASYLSKTLDVPQATIGRQLKKLEDAGYLEKDSNKGRRLTQAGYDFYEEQKQMEVRKKSMDKLVGLIEEPNKKNLLEIIEIRKRLEEMAVILTCKNITQEQIAELEAIMLAYSVEIRHGGSASELDLQLHLSIARFSGNNMLYRILKMLLTTDDAYVKYHSISKSLENRSLCVTQHDEIVSAIKQRDVTAACEKMTIHLNKVIKDTEQFCDL